MKCSARVWGRKLRALAIALILIALSAKAAATVMVPPPSGTNELAAWTLSRDLESTRQGYYFLNGKIQRLEREVERLESGFVLLSIILVSTGTAICVLALRDLRRVRRRHADNMEGQLQAANSITKLQV